MSKSKKVNFSRPQLLIEIENFQQKIDEFKSYQFKNGVAIKPLSSAKNFNESKKFDFSQENLQICNTGRKLSELKILEDQRVNLINSLQILKVSAVSAIAQKQEEIQKLKRRTTYIQDDNVEVYEQKLEEGSRLRQQLEAEREQLYHQIHQEREKYARDLEEREQHIEQLYQEIQQVRKQLQDLWQIDIAKTKKIKILQEQNQSLSQQLQISSISTALKERSQMLIDLDETIKCKTALSVSSSLPNKSFYSYIDSQHYFQSEADKSYMTQKIDQIQKVHKQELLDLRSFYEKRIASLRSIYERQLNICTEQSDRQFVDTRTRKQSKCSNSSTYKRNGSKKQLQGIQLNIKEMYAIQQNVENELETSRTNMLNLKSQIKMQNLSECPSVEPRFNTNDDAQSQFTTKYFDIPNRFMLKKNRSCDSITINNELESKTINKNCRKEDEVKQTVVIQNPEQNLVKKSVIFAAGLLSGITITSVIGYIFNKR